MSADQNNAGLIAEIEAWLAVKDGPLRRISVQEVLTKSLTALMELETLRADAERYRWLRLQHWNDSRLCVVLDPKNAVKLGHECPSDNRLDAAIDAART